MIGARVKASPEWQKFNNAGLGVSLNSPNFEPGAMKAMLSLIEQQYDHLTIDLTDTLNRHTYQAERNLSPSEAYLDSKKHGDVWLERNIKQIQQLHIPYKIVRWDHWLKDPRFTDYKNRFEIAFRDQEHFRQAVVEDINAYILRRFGKLTSELPWRVFQAGKAYLLEEMACHSIMYEQGVCATLYPGKQQKCYELVRNGLVANVPTGLSNSYFVRLVLHGMTQPTSSAIKSAA